LYIMVIYDDPSPGTTIGRCRDRNTTDHVVGDRNTTVPDHVVGDRNPRQKKAPSVTIGNR